jgi:hypothetical protein
LIAKYRVNAPTRILISAHLQADQGLDLNVRSGKSSAILSQGFRTRISRMDNLAGGTSQLVGN